MISRFILLIQFFIVSCSGLTAQSIDWLNFAELADRLRANPKPVMVFISADWCRYCKLQSSKTFKDKQVTEVLNEFYCLELNAENQEQIRFMNRVYEFLPRGVSTGTHELAQLLGNIDGKLTLPTTVFLNDQLQLVKREAGYLGTDYFLRWVNN